MDDLASYVAVALISSGVFGLAPGFIARMFRRTY